jgi:GT2 family glycosyltransferase
MPLVSIIVLNYNSADYIECCVDSVQTQSYPETELIIVDNASSDGSIDLVEPFARKDSSIRIIRNRENLGFASGMNAGALEANGEYLMFLNTDVVLAPDYVSIALNALLKSECRVGVVGGRIFRLVAGERTGEIDSGPIYLGRGFYHKIDDAVGKRSFVFGPAGSCPLVSKKMLDDIALENGDYYDSSYFMYAEDTDLWFRAQLRGWKCLYEPQAIAWHTRAGSFEGKRRLYERPLKAQRWAYRNRWNTMVKVLPRSLFFQLVPYLFLMELVTVGYLLLKSPGSLRALPLAALDAISSLPETLVKRKYIQSNRTVEKIELTKFFKGF